MSLKAIRDGRKISLHSSIDPIKEAKRFIESQNIPDTCNVVFLGCGLGYHLKEFAERSRYHGFILVIEKELEIFYWFLHNFDISVLFDKADFHFFVDESPDSIFKFIQLRTFDILANGIKVVSHGPLVNLYHDYYLKCSRMISDAYIWCRINVITQIRKSSVFADNTFMNFIPRLFHPGINCLKNVFKGVPGIVVATGPSLKKNINLLRKAKNKSVIIACDSSLKILKEEGILPDFVVSIDFTDNTIYDFEGVDKDDEFFVVVDNEVCPKVTEKMERKLFFIDLTEKPLCQWISSITENKGSMEKGLSVSHTAYLLAVYLGLNPIILVGQDLAFSDDETHARGASMGFTVKNTALSRDIFEVEDVFGGKVKTDKSLLVFLNHYRDLIRRSKGLKVYDATEGGAKIEGAEIVSFREAFFRFIFGTKAEAIKKINSIYNSCNLFNLINWDVLICRVKDKKDKLQIFLSEVEDQLNFLILVEKKYNKGDFLFIEKNLNRIEKNADIMKKHREELNFLRDCITEAFMLQSKRINYDDKNEKKVYKEIVERNKRLFEIFKNASLMMIGRLEKLENNLKLVSGKKAVNGSL